ncbi:hypothetical protein ACV3NV_14590 [Clostridium perfringens]|nr:hypothetical protein [Clostridium perfringens]MDK0757987.1 hypothetical protein [Clostridium perfringens]
MVDKKNIEEDLFLIKEKIPEGYILIKEVIRMKKEYKKEYKKKRAV